LATTPEDFINEYKDALLRVDGPALSAMHHDDAILISPGMGVIPEGREQIDAAWRAIAAMVDVAISFDVLRRDVVETGDYAIFHRLAPWLASRASQTPSRPTSERPKCCVVTQPVTTAT
jgi:ketosteroid isomerase-like protein